MSLMEDQVGNFKQYWLKLNIRARQHFNDRISGRENVTDKGPGRELER